MHLKKLQRAFYMLQSWSLQKMTSKEKNLVSPWMCIIKGLDFEDKVYFSLFDSEAGITVILERRQ